MTDEQADFIRRATKVLQRIPSDPSAGNLLIKSIEQGVATHLIEITSLGLTYGQGDELARLRKENAEIKAAAPKVWEEFATLAEAKGHKTMTDKAAAVGVDVAYLKTCRELNRVPFTLIKKLAEAPDDSDTESRADRAIRRQNALETALRTKEFLEFRVRHLDVPPPCSPEKAERNARSNMTAIEFKEVINVFFPGAPSDAARCTLLSVLTGYTELSHRSHAGMLKMDGAERQPRSPSVDLADYLRFLKLREEAFRRGNEMPAPPKRSKTRRDRHSGTARGSGVDEAA
jgi:hypothetical protein